jgi:tRNA threonylcarbamoyladenosine biosynthesis protein TsaB
MKVLAFDTSSEVLSAGLFDGDSRIGEIEQPLFTRHSSTLAPTLDALLKSRRMAVDDVDLIAVGLGPGSFTGLRVGVTTAKVLAYASEKKLVGILSFEAMAAVAPQTEGWIVTVGDAKKEKLYAAIFERRKGKLELLAKPFLTGIDEVLKQIKKPAIFLGESALPYRGKIENFKKFACRVLDEKETRHPKAQGVARLALERAGHKKFSDPFGLEPFYVHPRDCNVVRGGSKP